MPNIIDTLPDGTPIVLVDREQMRFENKKQMTYNASIEGFVSQPTPPPTFDWSKGRSIKFPILGNDHYGDCFYAAACHGAQSWNGMAGRPLAFDAKVVGNRYLVIAHGDNGLSDNQIIPEFKSGIVGPKGPHKILDDVQVDVTDDTAIALAIWAFGGAFWTCSLLPNWMPSRTRAGATWTNDGRPTGNGHALWMTGRTGPGLWQIETWAFDPPITLTSAGMRAARSEILVCFSMDMFDAAGFAPCGLHYLDLVPLWKSIGGIDLPASPFPAPDPEVLTYIPGG